MSLTFLDTRSGPTVPSVPVVVTLFAGLAPFWAWIKLELAGMGCVCVREDEQGGSESEEI